MKTYELDHWVLFDTLTPVQINRLKRAIDAREEGIPVEEALANSPSKHAAAVKIPAEKKSPAETPRFTEEFKETGESFETLLNREIGKP
ncbi:MAG: hypothetical protein D6679_04775 [Candidatus Hydrogenedentota bacterium]|nr:MAG: hypothetical protein D6679_04775 [Candidatus Hydrogenedentota bacterium]